MAVASLAELRRQQAAGVKSLGELQAEQDGQIASGERDPILGRKLPYRLEGRRPLPLGLFVDRDDPVFGADRLDDLFWGEVVGGHVETDDKGKLQMYYHLDLGFSPEMAAAQTDDITEALFGEKLDAPTAVGRIKDHWRTGQIQVQLSQLGMDVLNNRDTPQTWSEIERLRREIPVDVRAKFRPLWEKMLGSTAEMAPISVEGVKAAPVGATLGGMTGLAVGAGISLSPTLGEEVAIPALTWAGIKLGGGLATAERIGEIEAGLCLLDLLDMGIDPAVAKPAAIGVGIINGALETSQIAELLKTLPGGKSLGKKAMSRAINKLLKDGTLRNLAAQYAARYGTYLAVETGQELAQESTNVVAEELSKAIMEELSGREYDYATIQQIRDRMMEVGAKSLQAFTVMGAPGTAVSAALDVDATIQQQRVDRWFEAWIPDDRITEVPARLDAIPTAKGPIDERSGLVSRVAEKEGQETPPPAAEAAAEAEEKQPWEMTREEYGKNKGVSKSEGFEGAAKVILNEPGDVISQLALGNENPVVEKKDFYEYVTPKGSFAGRVTRFDVVVYESDRGHLRAIAYAKDQDGKRYDQPSAAIQFEMDEGRPKVLTIGTTEKGIGLPSALLDYLNEQYGNFGVSAPISKSGAAVTHKAYVRQATQQGKPVPREVLEEYKGEPWADEALAKMEPAAEGKEAPPVSGEAVSPADAEADAIAAGLRDLSYEALAEKARRIGVEVKGKKAQLAALIADAIKMKTGTRAHEKGHERVSRTRMEQRALVETEKAIRADPLYQEMERSAGYVEADIEMGLENRTRKGRVDPSFTYYVDPGYRGDVEGATGKLGTKGYKAKLARHITYTKGEGAAWDAAMAEQGLDYDFSQFLAELESSLYATKTGAAAINEVALDEAVATNEYGIALLAEKRRLLRLGTGAYTVNQELLAMAAAMRVDRAMVEDLLIGEGKLLDANDPHPGSLPYRAFFDRLGVELMDRDSEWMRLWSLLPDAWEKPRQMWKRLRAEWQAIQAQEVAADLDVAEILKPERELTDAERAEIGAIDAEKVADEIVAKAKSTLFGHLIQGVFDEAAEFRRLRAALHTAYREGHAEGIAQARAAYRAQDQKIKARQQLREYLVKLLAQIRRPVGKTVAVAQREAILEIQELLDPHFRARRTIAERQAARAWFADHPEAQAPAKVLRLIRSKSPSEMTVAEVEELARAVRELRRKGKILQAQRNEQRAATVADDTRAVVDAVTGGQAWDPDVSPVVGPPHESLWRRAKGLYAMTLTPERLLDWLDRGKDFAGPIFRVFWERVANAEKSKLRRMERRQTAANDALARFGLTRGDLVQPVMDIHGTAISAQDAIGIYNRMMNYKSRLAITFGNRIGRADQRRVAAYVEQTDPRLRQLADWVRQHYDRYYADLREAVIVAEDRDMGSEENYTPLRRMEVDYTPDERQIVSELMQRHHLKRGYAEKGMTIARKDIDPEYQKPVRIDEWTLLLEQIERQEHYIAYAELTKGLRQVVEDEGVKNAILDRAGRSVYKQVEGYVDAVANPNIYRTFSQVERWCKALRRNTSVAYLAYKLSTMLKQVPSMLLVLPEAGTDLAVAGMEAVRHPMEVRRFVVERDPMVEHATLERELEELRVSRPGEYGRILKKFGAAGLQGLYVTDGVARTIAWYGVYLHQLKAAAKTMDPVEADAEATRQARLAISRTQPGARAFQIPTLYRSDEVLNALLQFTNQLNKLWNIAAYDTFALWKNGHYQRAAMSFVALGINSLAIWAITNRRLPEDEEDLADAVSEQFINAIPLLGPAITSVERGFGAGGLPAVEGAAEFAVNLYKVAEDIGAGEVDVRTLEKAYRGAAPVVGLPYTGPKNIIETAATGEPVRILGGPPVRKGGGSPKTKASVTARNRRSRSARRRKR